jgi:hypothetical protein
MRLVLFVLGVAIGVAATLAYAVFSHPAKPAPVAQPLPATAPITVTLGERFLTGVLRRGALETPGVTVPRTALRAELRDDTIVVHANVEVLGRATESTATLRPVLRNGQLAIDVVSTNLGNLPLPAMEQVLEKQINARLQSLLEGMAVTITGVKVDRGKGLIITGDVDLDQLEQTPPVQAAR